MSVARVQMVVASVLFVACGACGKGDPGPSVTASNPEPAAPAAQASDAADASTPLQAPGGCAAGQRRVHDVVLQRLGEKVMRTIVKVRLATKLPLNEVNDLARIPGAVIKPGLSQADAEALRAELAATGATAAVAARCASDSDATSRAAAQRHVEATACPKDGAVYDVTLAASFGTIPLVKLLRQELGLSQEDAIAFEKTEGALIKAGLSLQAAQALRERFQAAKAVVNLSRRCAGEPAPAAFARD